MQLVAKSNKRLYTQTLKYNKTVTAHMYVCVDMKTQPTHTEYT